MRKIYFLITALFITFSISAQSTPDVDVRVELEEANRILEKAIEEKDHEAFSMVFTDDAVFKLSGYEALEGREAILAAHRPLMDQGMKLKLETDEVIHFGDYAHMTGGYSLIAPNGHQVDEGNYSTLWKNVNGKWQIYRDMTSNIVSTQ